MEIMRMAGRVMRNLVLALLLIFSYSSAVQAATYGSGAYGSDAYSASTTTTSTPTTRVIGGISNQQPASITPPVPIQVAYRFDVDLRYGARGEGARQLQQYLNTHGSPVAPSGVGSLGHETMYFGLATKAALQKFQAAHGIPATGNLGPITRGYINNAAAPVATPTQATLTVLAVNLNVRELPAGKIVGIVSQGTTGTVISTLGNWIKAHFSTGLEGYVYASFVKRQ